MPIDLITLNTIEVNVSLVEELIGCILTCDPGLSCGIAKSFISPSNSCPSHYVGVFLDPPSGTQFPLYADDTSRFAWNFLADRTSSLAGNRSSCTGKCNDEGEICVGAEWRVEVYVLGGGICVVSTTRYVPAYSTRLKFEDNVWHVLPANSSDPMSAADPVWTESFWNTIGLRVYAVQSATYDWIVLLVGVSITAASYLAVSITAASYLAVIIGRAYISKVIKRD